MVVEVTVKRIWPLLLSCVIVPVSDPTTEPVPEVGLVWVMLIVRVVPEVMVAPLPVVDVLIVPKLAKVLGLAFTVEGGMPVNVSVSVPPPLLKVMLLPPPLNEPVVE